LLVVPTGLDPPLKPGDLALRLDQSKTNAAVRKKDGKPVTADGSPIPLDSAIAFGTGVHPTTQMCLHALEDYLHPGEVVLDLGTGSGILAVAAAKLGAAAVVALDIDAAAVRVAREHVEINKVGHIVQVEQGSLERVLPDTQGAAGLTAHVVVANLATPVIERLLQEGLAKALKPAGLLIVSGFLTTDMAEVTEGLQAIGLEVAGQRESADWAAIISRCTMNCEVPFYHS
jgi:ribosomal protein L11 methyltransferase